MVLVLIRAGHTQSTGLVKWSSDQPALCRQLLISLFISSFNSGVLDSLLREMCHRERSERGGWWPLLSRITSLKIGIGLELGLERGAQ